MSDQTDGPSLLELTQMLDDREDEIERLQPQLVEKDREIEMLKLDNKVQCDAATNAEMQLDECRNANRVLRSTAHVNETALQSRLDECVQYVKRCRDNCVQPFELHSDCPDWLSHRLMDRDEAEQET